MYTFKEQRTNSTESIFESQSTLIKFQQNSKPSVILEFITQSPELTLIMHIVLISIDKTYIKILL